MSTPTDRDGTALLVVDVQGAKSGLNGLEQVLGHIDGIGFVRLSGRDVVRHRIVQDIVDAYDKAMANDQPDPGRGGRA